MGKASLDPLIGPWPILLLKYWELFAENAYLLLLCFDKFSLIF